MENIRRLTIAFLLIVTILDVPSAKAEKNDCDTYANKIADEFIINSNEIFKHFEKRITILKQNYNNERMSKSSISFEKILNNQVFTTSYNFWIKFYFDEYPVKLRKYASNKETQHLCEKFYLFKREIKKNLDHLKDILNQVAILTKERIELETLDDNEGYAVISASFNQGVKNIQLKSKSFFSKNLNIGPIKKATYFRVIKLKEGEYYWDRVRLFSARNTVSYYEFGGDNLSFKIQPGKINITGTLLYRRIGDRAKAEINDRSALIIKILRERYPDLINRFTWVNGFAVDDPFVTFFQQQLNSTGKGASNALP